MKKILTQSILLFFFISGASSVQAQGDKLQKKRPASCAILAKALLCCAAMTSPNLAVAATRDAVTEPTLVSTIGQRQTDNCYCHPCSYQDCYYYIKSAEDQVDKCHKKLERRKQARLSAKQAKAALCGHLEREAQKFADTSASQAQKKALRQRVDEIKNRQCQLAQTLQGGTLLSHCSSCFCSVIECDMYSTSSKRELGRCQGSSQEVQNELDTLNSDNGALCDYASLNYNDIDLSDAAEQEKMSILIENNATRSNNCKRYSSDAIRLGPLAVGTFGSMALTVAAMAYLF